MSTQHIATLFFQHLQAPAKRSQHLNATYRNIVGRNVLSAFGHPVATCRDMLGVENRTSAQHCCTNLAKRLQHRSYNIHKCCMKNCPFSNLKPRPNDRNMPTQHIATLLSATCCVRLATVLRCVATCWVLLAQI